MVEPARIDVDNKGAQINGDLTFSTVTRLFEDMNKRIRNGEMPSSIDLAGVGQIDSSGLALLLEWQSLFRARSGSTSSPPTLLEIRNPPESLLKIARLCDAQEYLVAESNDNETNALS